MEIKRAPPDPLYTLKGKMAPIYCLCFRFTNNTELLYAGTQEGKIHFWDLKSCRELNAIQVGSEPCLAIYYMDDVYITQIKCDNIKVWLEVGNSWTLKNTISSTYVGFCRVQLTSKFIICPDEASGASIKTIKGEVVENFNCKMTEEPGTIMSLNHQIILNNEYIFILYESGFLVIWKVQFGEVSHLKISSDCPMTLDFDGNSRGIIGTSGSNLVEFHMSNSFSITKGKDIPITNPGVSCVQIRPDKLIFVAGCWDGRIRFFSMKTLKLLAVLDHHQGSIHEVVFASKPVNTWKCNWLCAAGGLDKKITLWNLYDKS